MFLGVDLIIRTRVKVRHSMSFRRSTDDRSVLCIYTVNRAGKVCMHDHNTIGGVCTLNALER